MKKPLLLGIILTVCIVIVTFVFAQFYPEGMISYWKFDVDEGTTTSDSVDGNHGTIYGATQTTGKVGDALSFDGLNGYVEIPDDNSLDITGDLTLEAWIEPDSVYYTAQGEIIGKWVAGDASYYFAINDGQLQMRISVNGGDYFNIEETSDANLIIDTWYHVVGVYNASEQDIKLYINGVVEESTTVKGTIPSIIHSGSANVKIGGWWPGYYFEGIIDEVAIYGRALSADEIQQHFQNGSYEVECTTPPSGMVSWWDGDTDASDIQGGNNGTLINGALAGVAGKVDGAFSFDGSDDFVEIPDSDSLDTGTQFTVDAWFNTDDVDKTDPNGSKTQTIVMYGWDSADGKNNPLHIRYGKLSFVIRGYASEDLMGVTSVNSNTWYHAAVTYDGTTAKLYLNGALEDSELSSMNMNTNSRVTIGRYQNPSNSNTYFHFDGLIDEVEIFNRALSQEEIQAIYLAGSAGKCKVEPNQPPVAVCIDRVIAIVENCQVTITAEDVDGGSYDPDEGDTFTLSIDKTVLPFGEHDVSLTITDENGASDTCVAKVTVIDTTAPIIESFTVDPTVLWPPNHKMVLITPDIVVSDNCDSDPELVVVLISIEMNEGDEIDAYDAIYDSTLGSGHTTNDIQVDADGNISLRAERSGKGDGRIYTITYKVTDESGNSAETSATVTVPHGQK